MLNSHETFYSKITPASVTLLSNSCFKFVYKLPDNNGRESIYELNVKMLKNWARNGLLEALTNEQKGIVMAACLGGKV